MTTTTLTASSTSNGIVATIANPWNANMPSAGVSYYLYAATSASSLPPTNTSATAVIGITSVDSNKARMLWSTGTAGTSYFLIASATNMDTNEIAYSAVSSSSIAFPTITSPAPSMVVNNNFSTVISNTGDIYIYNSDNEPLTTSGGTGYAYSGSTTNASYYNIKRGTLYSQFGSGYTNLGTITTLPFIDNTAIPGVAYYYCLVPQDSAGAASFTYPVNGATSPATIPNSLGAVVPGAPQYYVYPANNSLWIYVSEVASNGADVLSYDIYCDTNYATNKSGNVLASSGPWYQLTQTYDGTAIANGSTYSVNVVAKNIIGAGAVGSITTVSLPATVPALSITYANIALSPTSPMAVLNYGISGGVPPYKATIYMNPLVAATAANAVTTLSNALTPVELVTNSQGTNMLIQVTDAAETVATLSYSGGSEGSFAPGDMSTYLDTWSTNIDSLYLDMPNCVRRVFLSGSLPASSTDTSKTHLVMVHGTSELFNVNASITIQGQTSAGANSKGYKAKLKNNNTGNKIQLKFGNWPALSTFDLKSYGFTDDTFIRDILGFHLWRDIIQTNPSYANILGLPMISLGAASSPVDYYGEAILSMDGFPIEMYLNGVYQGLYMWRTTVQPEIYQMDDSVMTNIIMKYDHTGGTGNGETVNLIDWTLGSVVSANWEMESPSVKAYTDQGSLSTQVPSVYESFNAVFVALGNYTTTLSDTSAIEKVLNKASLIDYAIFSSVAQNSDGINDNLQLVSWDGVQYSIMAYDLDLTFGNNNGDVNSEIIGLYGVGTAIFDICYNQWLSDTKTRYRYLRDSGIISKDTFAKKVAEQTGRVGSLARSYNKAEWGYFGATQEASINYMITTFNKNLDAIDLALSYPGNGVTFWS